MDDIAPPRFTINQVDFQRPLAEWKPRLADHGRRRHLCYSLDFDTRAMLLEDPQEGWDEEPKRLHLENRTSLIESLGREFGTQHLERKLKNFAAIKTKPFSILAYHNRLFDEVRTAFVMGAYYPALVGACALGERTLNHLVLDLRDHYSHTPQYKKVARKCAFDNWALAIDTLKAWDVLLPAAEAPFRTLMKLRHRSIHFNASTYATLREDALEAVLQIREIIEQQFSSWGLRPWFIEGSLGHIFIKRDWEENPFVKTFYLPQCPFVGPNFAISFEQGLQYHDLHDYGDGAWSDEDFVQAFNTRSPEDVVKTAT
ncbi:hypothetical protein AS593_06905 [Caulobacter vibrioides]|nr:hypothetical protein AS593_06905 [Caulobacter vibrioides]